MKKIINFKPMSNFVLVEHAIVTKTAGGLDLPESSWSMKEEVEVLARGSQVKELNIGDKIKLNPNRHATEITLDKVKYLLVSEMDVLGIITNKLTSDN